MPKTAGIIDTIRKPTLLLVEGDDELDFFSGFCRFLGIHDIQIMTAGGKDILKDAIKTITKTPGFDEQSNKLTSLGIVRDADKNPLGAFDSICKALDYAGLAVPSSPLISSKGSPKVTILIVPSFHKQGALEDLCLEAVATDPVMPCLENYFECLQSLQNFTIPKNLSKAKLLGFMASRPEVDIKLRVIGQKGYWPWDSPVFDEIKQFLRTLGGI